MGLNKRVSFSTAKLLNTKGLPGIKSFYDNKKHYELNPKKYTIAEVVMWLYEKHGIWISPQPFIKQTQTIVWLYDIFKNNYIIEQLSPSKGVNSPIEAYSKAIEYTLNNLI